VQYFTNGFDTKTKGVDLVATYHFNLGPGRLGTRWPITIKERRFKYPNNLINNVPRPGDWPRTVTDIQH